MDNDTPYKIKSIGEVWLQMLKGTTMDDKCSICSGY